MSSGFTELLEANPVIAAVKSEEGLAHCCELEEIRIVFVLYGTICDVAEIVKRIKDSGKIAMVHVDLVAGLAGRDVAVQFIRRHTEADGIISTKPTLIAEAKKQGLYTVLRVFLLDSMAYQNLDREVRMCRPDCVEVLPGLMPKVIRRIREKNRLPLIAGGLISDREDVMSALDAGAISVSATNQAVWDL